MWRQFMQDCRDLWSWLSGHKPEVVSAPRLPEPNEPPQGWYAWECERFTRCPSAFWLDPRRYDGTEFAFVDPTPEDIRRAQDAVAGVFGIQVIRPLHFSQKSGNPYASLLNGNALAQSSLANQLQRGI